MSEKSSSNIEKLSVQLKEAEAQQKEEVADSAQQLEDIWLSGKEGDKELDKAKALSKQFSASMGRLEAKGLTVSEVIRRGKESADEIVGGIEQDQEGQRRRAQTKLAEPGVQYALEAQAEKMDRSHEVDRLRSEAKKELKLMAEKVSLQIDVLAQEYEKAIAEVKNKENAVGDARSKSNILENHIRSELRKVNETLLERFDSCDLNNHNPNKTSGEDLQQEFQSYRDGLGFMDFGKKKTMDSVIAELAQFLELKSIDKDYVDSHGLLYSDQWPGLVTLKNFLVEGINRSAEYQSQIDDMENEHNKYNGLKNMFIEPIRFRLNKNTKFYDRAKKILDDVEYHI
ncbi:MAG: hypothetical protein NVSMB66_4150 [Candidatus Doudnabacteria bacterium]